MNQHQAIPSTITAYAIRLHPHQDVLKTLSEFVKKNQLQACSISTCVGSLEVTNIRLADSTSKKCIKECVEIVSLVGTFSKDGHPHVHLSVADKNGNVFGGHMLEGCLVYTTAEIVLLELNQLSFSRQLDETYGWKELVVEKRK